MKIIVASATWCAPCKAYKEMLASLMQEQPDVQVEILDVAKEKERVTQIFGEVTQLPWTVIQVADATRCRFFGAVSKKQMIHHMAASREA